MTLELVLVKDWSEVSEVQSLEPVADYDKDRAAGLPFAHFSDTRNSTRYASWS